MTCIRFMRSDEMKMEIKQLKAREERYAVQLQEKEVTSHNPTLILLFDLLSFPLPSSKVTSRSVAEEVEGIQVVG